jgi:hypothetical protein
MSCDAGRTRQAGGLLKKTSLTMDRNGSSPDLRHDKERDIRSWLLDNWIYQHKPGNRMNAATSPPRSQGVGMDSEQHAVQSEQTFTILGTQGFNINEDDLDCPGHERVKRAAEACSSFSEGDAEGDENKKGGQSPCEGRRHRLMSTSSSEGLCDVRSVAMVTSSSSDNLSAEDEEEEEEVNMEVKGHAMSVDDDRLITPSHHFTAASSDPNNNSVTTASQKSVVTFAVSTYDDDDTGNDDDDTDDSEDSNLKTPTRRGSGSASLAPNTFFKLERRASFDNGVFGMPDRIMRGEVLGSTGVGRNAVTAPGTPADPGTPVGRCLSEEELILHPEMLFTKIHDRE